MNDEPRVKIISVLTKEQEVDLVSLYRNEFWCNSRRLQDVEVMLRNTDIIVGAEHETGRLVGFARVLTDYVYKATLYDVIVHADYRNTGLGALIMVHVVNHPQLAEVETMDLNCLPEMHGFYEKWKVTEDVGHLTFMRRFHKHRQQ